MYIQAYNSDLGELGRFRFKSVFKAIVKPFKQLNQIRLVAERQVVKEINRSPYAKAIIYGAGAVFAPVTGGLSMSAAAAAIQASKARATGKSVWAQLAQGIGAGAVGYVAGKGLVWGYNAVSGAVAAPTYGSSSISTFVPDALATPAYGAAAPYSALAPEALSVPAYGAAAPYVGGPSIVSTIGSTLSTIGSGLMTAVNTIPVITTLMQAMGGRPVAGESGGGRGSTVMYYGPDYGAAQGAGPGGGGDSGGGGPIPEAVAAAESFASRNMPLIIGGVAVATIAGVVYSVSRKRRKRK